jgi:hypothetical protein
MANEFYYCVSLSIVHPTIDPSWITQAIPSLHPRIQAMAGTERLGKDGKPTFPPRTTPLSHWLADLHEEPKLYSAEKPLSDFLLEKLSDLEKHREVFGSLEGEAQIALIVGWFSEHNHSAEVLDARTLKKCGDMGIDIEIDFYSPEGQVGH